MRIGRGDADYRRASGSRVQGHVVPRNGRRDDSGIVGSRTEGKRIAVGVGERSAYRHEHFLYVHPDDDVDKKALVHRRWLVAARVTADGAVPVPGPGAFALLVDATHLHLVGAWLQPRDHGAGFRRRLVPHGERSRRTAVAELVAG